MKRISRLNYAYAVGRIKALEKNLIPQAVFREAAEEGDLADALKAIFDAGAFLEEKVEIGDSVELDELLSREEKALARLLSETLIEKEIVEIFRLVEQPEQALALALRLRYSFIAGYFRHKIDLGNLKILARLKYTGQPRERFEALRLKGGFLDDRLLSEGYGLSFSELAEKLRGSPYRGVWERGMDTLVEKETFLVMEREFEDFLMGYLRRAKAIVFGPEPVFAYALARRRELNLLRLVGIGKMNRIPAEILKERIAETYV